MLYFLFRNYTQRNLKEIFDLLYNSGFQVDRKGVGWAWAAVITLCFMYRGPADELLAMVSRITQDILRLNIHDSKLYLREALLMLKELNSDLDRKVVVDYLEQTFRKTPGPRSIYQAGVIPSYPFVPPPPGPFRITVLVR